MVDIVLDLSKHDPIPKHVHVSWKHKDVFSNQSPVILNGIGNMRKINPEYVIEISDDADVDAYLREHISIEDYDVIKNRKIVEKVDLWRLLKIYHEGGIYVDIDRYCNIPFDSIIHEHTKCVLPTCRNLDFAQDIMISCKHNPIFEKALELNLARRKEGRGLYFLGAPTFMHAVTEVVFGERMDQTPGDDVMERLRHVLNATKQFRSYMEIPPRNTIIYKHDDKAFLQGNGKRKYEFYGEQNVIAWNARS